MTTKVCSKCGEEKDIEEFHKNKNTRDGHGVNCKLCIHNYAINRVYKKSSVKCLVSNCNNTIEKGAHGLCGMHYMRNKRYGDINYITSNYDQRFNCRIAQPTLGNVQQHVYKKFLGRHEHRRVMEEHIGRKLESNEIVHHIDFNQHNNDIKNLIIMTPSEHSLIHWERRRKLKNV